MSSRSNPYSPYYTGYTTTSGTTYPSTSVYQTGSWGTDGYVTFSVATNFTASETLADVKKLEQMLADHKLSEFFIAAELSYDYPGNTYTYTFITSEEAELLKKYNTGLSFINSTAAFKSMLSKIDAGQALLVLASTGSEHRTIESLRRDYLIITLSGIET